MFIVIHAGELDTLGKGREPAVELFRKAKVAHEFAFNILRRRFQERRTVEGQSILIKEIESADPDEAKVMEAFNKHGGGETIRVEEKEVR